MDGGLRYASLLTDSDIENILKRVDPNITGATIEKREYKRTAAGELLTVDVTIEYIDDDLEQIMKKTDHLHINDYQFMGIFTGDGEDERQLVLRRYREWMIMKFGNHYAVDYMLT